jgi:hypothetical protein
MKRNNQRIVFLLAGIGIGALIFGGIEIYQREIAQEQSAAFVNAPATGIFGDALKNSGPPPPQ